MSKNPDRQIEPMGRPLAACMRDYYERNFKLDAKEAKKGYSGERRRRIDFLVRDLSRPTSIPMKYRMSKRRLLSNLRHGKAGHPNHVFLYGAMLSLEDYDVLEMQQLPVDVFRLVLIIFQRKTTVHEVATKLGIKIDALIKILNGQILACHDLSLDIRDVVRSVDERYQDQMDRDVDEVGNNPDVQDGLSDDEVFEEHDYIGKGYPDDFNPDIHDLKIDTD